MTNSAAGLSRDTSRVRLREQRAEVRAAIAQHRALAKRLADRHEDARRQALAGDVAQQEEQSAIVEPVEIVEVAADFERRLHRRGEIDARVAQRLGARQRIQLDPLRGLHLAGDARALLALTLHHFLQRLAVARRGGQRHRDAACRTAATGRAPASPRRTAAGAYGTAHSDATSSAAMHASTIRRRVADRPTRRHPDQQRAQQERGQRFDQRGRQRPDEECVLAHVLQQLRMDLDAGDRLADRRPHGSRRAQAP